MKLEEKIQIIGRKKLPDSRGWFLKVITGKEDYIPSFTGEVYVISASAGESRANHYHPEACEWFTPLSGKARMLIEDIQTKERLEIQLDSETPQTVYVPNNIAHSFQNFDTEPFLLVTYTNKLYDPSDTITYKF